jgi:hypothetical protein
VGPSGTVRHLLAWSAAWAGAAGCAALFEGPGDYPKDAGAPADGALGDVTLGDAASGDGSPTDAAALLGRRRDTSVFFCDDFDRDAIVGWAMSGTVDLVTDASTSTPASLRATASATATTGAIAALRRDFTSAKGAVFVLGFDLRVDTKGAGQAYVGYLEFADSQVAYYALQIGAGDALTLGEDLQTHLSDGGQDESNDAVPCGEIPSGWFHADLKVDLTDPTTASESLAVDGVSRCTKSLKFAGQRSGAPGVAVGIPWANPQNGGWTVHVDSVVFDTQ